MDPRTAYLHCHELQYGDFCSVQGLLEAIKDYQRMAPDQISNDNLISILWNKVPIKLQKEVGEIKDWSLQELLHRLLRAEARVAERERRNPQFGPKRRLNYSKDRVDSSAVKKVESKEKTQAVSSKKKVEHKPNIDAEMRMKNLKCYKCQKEGHIARLCPESRMISLEDGTSLPSEKSADAIPWIRVLTVSGTTSKYEDNGAKLSGPTYKIDIEVEGVKTQALLDSGSQVTLVRAELLTLVEQRKGWTTDKCKKRDCELKTQPVGVSGTELGAKAVVSLHTTVEQTGQEVAIPCFVHVLKSSKPVWQVVQWC